MLEIRAMRNKDIDRVYAIEMASHKAPWSRDILRDCVLVGYDCRVLERFDEPLVREVVGYMICRRSEQICHILNLCVDSAYQRQGYGRFLLKNLLDSLSPQEVTTLVLEVRPSNVAAIALYESFGFQQEAIKKEYYKDSNGHIEDALVFRKMTTS